MLSDCKVQLQESFILITAIVLFFMNWIKVLLHIDVL